MGDKLCYGKFVFRGKELVLTELELISLMKVLKSRNTRLFERFKLFYDSIIDDRFVDWFNKLGGVK